MTAEFKSIVQGEDTREFLGQVVAFRTNNPHFAAPEKTWSVGDVYFGLVSWHMDPWDTFQDRGPNLSTVLLPNRTHSTHSVTRDAIRREDEGFLEMRQATYEEQQAINRALLKGEAVSEYNWAKNLYRLPPPFPGAIPAPEFAPV